MCVCVHKNSRAHEISSEIIFVSYLPSSAFRADILCHNEKSVRTCHFLAHLQGTKTLGLSLKHTHAVSIQQLEGWVGHSPPEFFPHSQIRHLSMWAPFGSASLVGPLPAQRLVLQQPPPHGLPLLESHWPPRIGGGGGGIWAALSCAWAQLVQGSILSPVTSGLQASALEQGLILPPHLGSTHQPDPCPPGLPGCVQHIRSVIEPPPSSSSCPMEAPLPRLRRWLGECRGHRMHSSAEGFSKTLLTTASQLYFLPPLSLPCGFLEFLISLWSFFFKIPILV